LCRDESADCIDEFPNDSRVFVNMLIHSLVIERQIVMDQHIPKPGEVYQLVFELSPDRFVLT